MMSGRIPPESTQRQIALLNNEKDALTEDLNNNYKNKYSQVLIETVKKAMNIKEGNRFQDTSIMQDSIMQDGLTLESRKPKKIKKEALVEESNSNWIKNSIIILLLVIIGVGLYTINNINKEKPLIKAKKETQPIITKVQDTKPIKPVTPHIEHKVTKLPTSKPSPQINFNKKKTLDINHDKMNLVVT